MRTILIALLLLAPVSAYAFEPNVNGFDADFAQAKHCGGKIDGRQVWQGKKAYYVQAWWGYTPGQKIDPENVDVLKLKGTKRDEIKPFADACK